MRKAIRVFSVWMVATVGLLTACGPVEESPESQVETEALEVAPGNALDTPAGLKAPPGGSINSCFTTSCKAGAEGDAYCTSICGDVARCLGRDFGCGYRGCCVLM